MKKIIIIIGIISITISMSYGWIGDKWGNNQTRTPHTFTDSVTFTDETVFAGDMWLDAAAGKFVVMDGSVIYFTDGTEADSTSLGHDGASFVITGDGGTDRLELEGIDIELKNGTVISNPHADTITVSEANFEVDGNIILDAAAGALTITDGSYIYLTDGTEADSGSIVHDGASLVVTGDGGTDNLELEGIDFELKNGGLLTNPHADTVKVTEAVLATTGDVQVQGNNVIFGNGSDISNPHADSLLLTETCTKIAGNAYVTGNIKLDTYLDVDSTNTDHLVINSTAYFPSGWFSLDLLHPATNDSSTAQVGEPTNPYAKVYSCWGDFKDSLWLPEVAAAPATGSSGLIVADTANDSIIAFTGGTRTTLYPPQPVTGNSIMDSLNNASRTVDEEWNFGDASTDTTTFNAVVNVNNKIISNDSTARFVFNVIGQLADGGAYATGNSYYQSNGANDALYYYFTVPAKLFGSDVYMDTITMDYSTAQNGDSVYFRLNVRDQSGGTAVDSSAWCGGGASGWATSTTLLAVNGSRQVQDGSTYYILAKCVNDGANDIFLDLFVHVVCYLR